LSANDSIPLLARNASLPPLRGVLSALCHRLNFAHPAIRDADLE